MTVQRSAASSSSADQVVARARDVFASLMHDRDGELINDQGEPFVRLFTLVTDVLDGTVREDAAADHLREDTSPLPCEAVVALSINAMEFSKRGAFRHASTMAGLAMAAGESRWGRTRSSPWWVAAGVYVDAVLDLLEQEPDITLQSAACEVVDLQIAELRREGATEDLVDVLTMAGWLRMTPYVHDGVVSDAVDQHRRWLERERRAEGTGTLLDARRRRPVESPLQAIQQALPYLDEAVGSSSGYRKAAALRARAFACKLLVDFGAPDKDSLLRVQTECVLAALPLLDPEQDAMTHLHVTTALWLNGLRQAPGSMAELLPVPLGEIERRFGIAFALRVGNAALSICMRAGAQQLVRELKQAMDAVRSAGPQRIAKNLAPSRSRAELHVLPGDTLTCFDADRALRSGKSRQRPAASLLHMAVHACDQGDGIRAMELLDRPQDHSNLPSDVRAAAFRLKAWAGDLAGDQHRAAGRNVEAMQHYAGAGWRYLFHGLDDQAVDCVARIVGTYQRAAKRPGVLGVAAHSVGAIAAWLSRAQDRKSVEFALYQAYQELSRVRLGTRAAKKRRAMGFTDMVTLHRVAKGMESDVIAESPSPRALTDTAREQLEKAATAQEKLGQAAGNGNDFDLLRSLSYLSEAERGEGLTAEEEAANLWRAFDRKFNNTLVAQNDDPANRFLRFTRRAVQADLERQLPENTVLLSLLAGTAVRGGDRNRHVALHTMRVARGDLLAPVRTFSDLDSQLALMGADDHHDSLTLHPFATHVTQMIGELVRYSGWDQVTPEALEFLDATTYFGDLTDAVASWREAGRTHLCVWPHGPLHRIPFHLLHVDGRPLADEFVVTTVQGLHSLERLSSAPPPDGGHLIAASACGGVAFRMHDEPRLEAHAYEVAEGIGATPLIGSRATREALMERMPGARFIHIAAHGSRNDIAGWRQCLYMTPSDQSDGRIFAHDILELDLRGVEMVTLSACETSSFRFDLLDNQRGLAPAFLMAGAAAVVGCLWEVHRDPATFFFRELHYALQGGSPKIEAFRTAQHNTRQCYPEYRHWGAFTYIGAW
ncbi:CHAT domain-containing protein [Streptomyces sp. NPDC001851]|uniref:CHAT domain-containing protein n=1 Tax=Streptomyces sp. NPDC001851 TaxID=3154529 RepID=UPI003330F57C